MPVDKDFAARVAADLRHESLAPHQHEHTLEVQLPFLQAFVGDAPIVPILFGSDPEAWHFRLGEQLAESCDDSDLVVASTDLSHFLSQEKAEKIDGHSLQSLLNQDYRLLAQELAEETCSMCGGTAVAVAMAFALARGAREWQILHYSTSAATSGDYRRVVGYGAVSMETAA
jgi:hypothetical protein